MSDLGCLYCNIPYTTQDGRTWCPNPDCPGNVGNPRPGRHEDDDPARHQIARNLIQQLKDVLESDAPWQALLWEVARLKRREAEKVQVESIISVLAGMDVLSAIMKDIEIQIGDEAIYQHLITCSQVIDDEDTKQKFRDFAELFAFEFCK